MSKKEKSAIPATASAAVAALEFLPRRLVRNVPLNTLTDHPGNPKDHDLGAIYESMQANGVVDMIYVQEWPDTPLYVIAGHGRKATLIAAGAKTADCIFVKISPAAARRYLLAANRAAERGGWNDDLLVEYLKQMAEHDELAGTGYDADDVDDLVSTFNPPTLNELERKHGAAGEDAAWPVYRCRLPHESHERLLRALKAETAPTEFEALDAIVARSDAAKRRAAKESRAKSAEKPKPKAKR